MESTLLNASLLLFIGMCTVFFILFIVVSGGNLLIHALNKMSPDIKKIAGINDIHPKKHAAIIAAVDIITHGAGKVEEVHKIT